MTKLRSRTAHPQDLSEKRVTSWLAEVEAADNPALRCAIRELSHLAAAVGLIDVSVASGEGQSPPPLADLSAARTLTALGHAGVAAEPVARLLDASPGTGISPEMVTVVRDAIEHNPLPDYEWAAVRAILDDEVLAQLLEISTQSIRRYANRERATPDAVAARLHFVALVNGDLIGSYNERGIRRWWQRPRAALDGRSPLGALAGGWDPDQTPTAGQIRQLAAGLVGAGAAT